MFELIYRYDPGRDRRQPLNSSAEAQLVLENGNRDDASIRAGPRHGTPAGSQILYFNLEDLGIGESGAAPRQQPFAVVVGCSDARVPTELICNRACDDLFVVRVAGNLLNQEGLGSIESAGLLVPPSDTEGQRLFALQVASSPFIANLLEPGVAP